MSGFLVLFHCESNPGYAASSHEFTFLQVALHFAKCISNVHFAYANLDGGMTAGLPKELTNVIQLDTRWASRAQLNWIEQYIKRHNITYALGFDQPVSRPAYKAMRRGGLQHFVSYWGAPMSSINSGLKLAIKRLEVSLRQHGPQHYIFQSNGMQNTATHGRGIPKSRTSIVKTGIDAQKFCASKEYELYAHNQFGIPKNRRIVVFSGHMEKRKGVHIAIQAMDHLVNTMEFCDAQLLILGNRKDEHLSFLSYLNNPRTKDHVTFGGYRKDVHFIFKSCSIGIIASTDWDSFPMSSLEMAASELPLLVSNIPGLNETISSTTGSYFENGDFVAAAQLLKVMLTNPDQLISMGKAGRSRVLEQFSRASQAQGIIEAFNKILPRD